MVIPNFDHAHPKMIEIIFTFPEVPPVCKNSVHSISIHSWDTVNFRVLWPDWPHTFLTTPTSKVFDQLMWIEFVSTCKISNYFINLFWRHGWLKKPAMWLAQNILADISGIKFPKYEICGGKQQMVLSFIIKQIQ